MRKLPLTAVLLAACAVFLAAQEVPGTSASTELYPATFKDCVNLKSIVIPANIQRIRSRRAAADNPGPVAFDGCSSLSEITFLGNLEEGDFTGAGIITKLVIGSGVTRLNVKLNLPNMPLAEQAKLRELASNPPIPATCPTRLSASKKRANPVMPSIWWYAG
jgi:hypothetical protein